MHEIIHIIHSRLKQNLSEFVKKQNFIFCEIVIKMRNLFP